MNKNMVDLLIRSLESERDRIDDAISELKGQVPKSGQSGASGIRRSDIATGGGQASTPSGRPKRTMSAAAKRKISEAMKRRYAELRKAAKK
jgi:hypothetical protein